VHRHGTECTDMELSAPTGNWAHRHGTECTDRELSTPTGNWVHRQATECTDTCRCVDVFTVFVRWLLLLRLFNQGTGELR